MPGFCFRHDTSIGPKVQQSLAAMMIGSVVSSTLLTLFVIPALYRLVHRPASSTVKETAE